MRLYDLCAELECDGLRKEETEDWLISLIWAYLWKTLRFAVHEA